MTSNNKSTRFGASASNGGMGPWAFGVSLVLVSALGLLTNAYVLLVALALGKQSQQQQTANTLLLIHLGAVEFAVCLVLLIFTTGGWPISGSSCILHGFLLAVLHPVALWTVTGLNCDRYCAIAAPLHYAALVSPRRVSLGLAASWAGALLLSVPPVSGIVPPYTYSPGLGFCVPDFGNDTWGNAGTVYGAAYVFLGIALPAILVTLCNLRVLGIARYHRHRIASAIYEVTLSAQVTITHQRNPFVLPAITSPSVGAGGPPPRFRSAASTVMQLVGSLCLLYIPYCALILWEAIGAALTHQQQQQHRSHSHPRLASLASLLLATSPPINGLLYGLKSPTLRRSIRNYWRKKVTKSELQQEIQARTPSVAGSRRPSGSGPATGASLFPFPPLQRRLSDALIGLSESRNAYGGSEAGIVGTPRRSRLQAASSCNTLRVPTTCVESSGEIRGARVRACSSAVSLTVSDSRSNDLSIDEAGCRGEKTRGTDLERIPVNESPKILITRASSVDDQTLKAGSTASERGRVVHRRDESFSSRCHKRRWRHISTGSESSTGSSDPNVWTTGLTPTIARLTNLKSCMEKWPIGKRCESRVRNTEAGARGGTCSSVNNSESSDCTDTTTTLTLSSKVANLIHTNGRLQEITVGRNRSPETRLRHSESEPTSYWSSSDERGANLFGKDESPSNNGREHRRRLRNGARTSRRKKRRLSIESREATARQLMPLLTLS